MKKQLTRIAPLKAGIVLGTVYGLLSLIIVPFFLVFALVGGAAAARTGSPFPAFLGVGMAIMMPIVYAVMGFIGGLLGAAIYNLVTKWTGGLEFEVRDVPPEV